jgi:hypothetical protein
MKGNGHVKQTQKVLCRGKSQDFTPASARKAAGFGRL